MSTARTGQAGSLSYEDTGRGELFLTTSDCPYCWKLETADEFGASEVVWHFPHSVALLGPWQFYRGYCILVSRCHAVELSELSADVRRAYLDEMCLLARAIELGYRPHKLNYELLGNQVRHLHWHLFPRYLDDPDWLHAVWLNITRGLHEEPWRRRMEIGREERGITIANLQQALEQLDAPRV